MKALDLFCGRGGWTKGLQAAGFDVTGVDVHSQPDYPGRFIQADVRDFRARRGEYQVVVASPPCQGFSLMNRQVLDGRRPSVLDYRLVLEALRVIGEAQPQFWAVENVQGAVGYFRAWMGEPKIRARPWFVWGHFPPFLREQQNGNKVVAGGDWRRTWANMDKKKRAALTSEIPAHLARPFAAACAAALEGQEKV